MRKWLFGAIVGVASAAIGGAVLAAGPAEKRSGPPDAPAPKQVSPDSAVGRQSAPRGKQRRWVYGSTGTASEYWVGAECYPVPPALKAHLGLESGRGLLVAQVLPEGPAAKAGLREHDVLTAAAGKPLGEVADLIAAIDAAGQNALALDLVRDGKPMTLQVQPAKRPEAPEVADEDMDVLRGWLERMMPGENLPPRFFVLRPGTILPPGVSALPPLPDDATVVITRRGSQPARIVVEQGSKRWEVTEKELDKLPSDLRAHVERMVHPYLMPAFTAGAGRTLGVPSPETRKQVEKQLEKHMEDVERQIQKLQQSIEELHRGRK